MSLKKSVTIIAVLLALFGICSTAYPEIAISGGSRVPGFYVNNEDKNHILVDMYLTYTVRVLAESRDGGETFTLAETQDVPENFAEDNSTYILKGAGHYKWDLLKTVDNGKTWEKTSFARFREEQKQKYEEERKQTYISKYGDIFAEPSGVWYVIAVLLVSAYIGLTLFLLSKAGWKMKVFSVSKSVVLLSVMAAYFHLIFSFRELYFRNNLPPALALSFMVNILLSPGWLFVVFLCSVPILPSTPEMLFGRSSELTEGQKGNLIIWNVTLPVVWLLLSVAGGYEIFYRFLGRFL